MSHSAWSTAPVICANGPGSPHWIAIGRVRRSSIARTGAGSSAPSPWRSGAKMLSTSRARCSAPTCGKLLNTSPQPHAPSLAATRRNTAGRLVIAPNALATGCAIGARNTQHSTFSIRGVIMRVS